jgi:transposase
MTLGDTTTNENGFASGMVNLARLDEGCDLTGDFDPASKFDLAAGRNNELLASLPGEHAGEILTDTGGFRRVRNEAGMEVVHQKCCGLDVHQASVCACVAVKEGRKSVKYKRRFGTRTDDLRALADWLRQYGVTHVAMEATGVYWKPVWNILEGQFELLLVNPQHLKAIPGKKTDMKDGERIADLLQHGLLRASFVPPIAVRELRDLTRSRASLAQERSRIANRIQKVLEDANIKLGSVASDVLGVSGRQMLEAIIAGEQDPDKLADLARGTLRKKIPELRRALLGQVRETQRFLLRSWLRMLDFIDSMITQFDQQIHQQGEPFQETVAAWSEIPGVSRLTAWTLAAELGTNMDQFETAGHLASWACVCPGTEESAGKRMSGKTRKGSVWLRRGLCEAAWGASRTKASYYRSQYQRLSVRRGRKRALIAVAHSILVTAYYICKRGSRYADLGTDYFDRRDRERTQRRLVKRLENLGYAVTLGPAAAGDTP